MMGIDPTDEAVADAHADALVRLLLGPPRDVDPAGSGPSRIREGERGADRARRRP
jgi:hypothetical protein